MKVQLSLELVEQLLVSGVLRPCDIMSLDIETRNELKKLCLKMSVPKACQSCEHRDTCYSPAVRFVLKDIDFSLQ